MRPYLAIIKDSFREAFHSRVLWIVLVIISLFLLVIAPLSYRQTLTIGIKAEEVEWPRLVALFEKVQNGQGTRGQQRIWSMMSSQTQESVKKYKPLPAAPQLKDLSEHAELIRPMLNDLQAVLKRMDLYQSQSFTSAALRMEGKELVRREKELTDEERQRLNRLILESAFGDAITKSESTSLQFRYAVMDVLQPFPINKPMLVTGFRLALPVLVDKGLLAIGLLIAVIVTAPAIPQTFEPGSLHLLLSKPMSRSMLYLSKFCGSCAFVLLCSAYLFFGMVLILWMRWGLWEPRLLWCIPLYTFVFAIYYSVAALAGLFWRNMIVSILVAIVFWGVCFGVGLGKVTTEGRMNKYRLKRLVPAGDRLVVVDGTNTPLAWDPVKKRWEMVILAPETRDVQPTLTFFAALPPMHGPVYDPREERLISVMMSLSNAQQVMSSAKAVEGFTYKEGPAMPFQPLELINEPDGQPLLISTGGLYRPQGDLGPQPDEVKIMGFRVPFTARGPLREAGPTKTQVWDEPFSAAFSPDGTLFTYSRGKLQSFTKNKDGKYEPQATEKFEKRSERSAQIAAGKQTLLLGLRNGQLQLRNPQTFALQKSLELTKGESAQAIAASPDGKLLAVVMSNRKLWLLQDGQEEFQLARVGGQGEISAVAFTPEGQLLVCDLVDRVSEYDTTTWQRKSRFVPPMQLTTMAYHYLVNPVYMVCPKPGEFYRTVTYLLLDPAKSSTTAENEEEADRPGQQQPSSDVIQNPWQPVYSSFAFMVVMLAIGCVYMERQEF